MNQEIINNLYNFLPELTLAFTIILLNALNGFSKKSNSISFYIFIAGISVSVLFSFLQYYILPQFAFSGIMVIDHFSAFGKTLTGSMLLFNGLLFYRKSTNRAELALITLLTLGGYLSLSSVNLYVTFITLEVMSISVYMLISPAGKIALKYFITGAVSSGLLLYGITLLAGISGSGSYPDISWYLSFNPFNELTVKFAVILIFTGMAFKMLIFPFNPVFPSVAEKLDVKKTISAFVPLLIVSLLVLARFLLTALRDAGNFNVPEFTYSVLVSVKPELMIVVFSSLSILAGSMVIFRQKNLNKILAFLVIYQSGLLLLCLSSDLTASTGAMLAGIFTFTVSVTGLTTLINLLKTKYSINTTDELNSIGRAEPFITVSFILFLLAMAGFPLTTGFIFRLILLPGLTQNNYFIPLFITVFSSLAVLYFIFILSRSLFYCKPAKNQGNIETVYKIILLVLLIPAILFGLYAEPLFNWLRISVQILGI